MGEKETGGAESENALERGTNLHSSKAGIYREAGGQSEAGSEEGGGSPAERTSNLNLSKSNINRIAGAQSPSGGGDSGPGGAVSEKAAPEKPVKDQRHVSGLKAETERQTQGTSFGD